MEKIMKIKQFLFVAFAVAATPAFAADPTAETATPQEQPTAAPAAAIASGTVARSAFTTAVADREPVDSINTLATDNNKIYYFTELKDMEGQQVTHRWEYNGKVMAEVPFQVGGSRWRVYSSKTLDNVWQGEWKVSVIDQAGGTLSVNTFKYEAAPMAAPAAPAAVEQKPEAGAPAK
jgi:hypothetical protein